MAYGPSAFSIGTRFAGYTLGRRIGSGGYATVYAARQESSLEASRLVALKIVQVGESDPAARSKVRREAAVAMRLEHPSIVRTYDVGEQDASLYLAMELLTGHTLEAAHTSPPSLPVAVRIIADLARALHYAHELRGEGDRALGLVHQDVSPQNVIVGFDGRVRLLDFGVARLAEIDASRTDTVRGKPAYLSPEQLEGERIDRRADIFALGIVAFELLSGRRLFRRDTLAATYRAVLSEPIPDLAELVRLPAALADAIDRALRRDRQARWRTARELAEAVEDSAPGASDQEVAAWVARVGEEPWEAATLEHEIAAAVDEPPPEAVLPKPRRIMPWLAVATVLVVISIGAFSLRRAAAPTIEPAAPPLVAITNPPPSATTSASALTVPGISSATPTPRTSAPKQLAARASSSAKALDVTLPASASAATTPPIARASLSVWSSVWGHVELDGRAVGDSPLVKLPTTPGHHALRVVTDHGEQSRGIDIAPDEDRRERFVF